MFLHAKPSLRIGVVLLILVGLAGCNYPGLTPPTPTPLPTRTPAPSPTPMPTDTPQPTSTATIAPTVAPTLMPTVAALPSTPTTAVDPENPILVYYINKEQGGPYGCGEALWYIKTKMPITGNILVDVRSALSTILAYHSETIGTLYNPGYSSNLAVSGVDLKADGTVVVALTGTYERTKDRCDGKRLIDQLRLTIKQFAGVGGIQITINGTPIADAVSRK
jgi:hypothetical protein